MPGGANYRPTEPHLARAKERVGKVARGGHINTTYRMEPGAALDAFRADLLRLLAAVP
jgi:hypothetical protein